jgi:tRNA(fMet)-specific endonuclease VapC
MSVGELAYGAAKARNPAAERGRVERLVGILDEGAVTKAVMLRFGHLKAELEAAGTPLADADLLIAATALEHGMALVTGNTKHFARIPGLQLENWF